MNDQANDDEWTLGEEGQFQRAEPESTPGGRLTRAEYQAALAAKERRSSPTPGRVSWVLGIAALLLIAGGGVIAFLANDDEEPLSSADLRPASEVREAHERQNALVGSIGESVELADGLEMTVLSITPEAGEIEGPPRWEAMLRTENKTQDELSNPEIAIRCANTDEGGSWYAHSTFDMYASLPPGTYSEGTVVLGMPASEDSCEEPVVSISPLGLVSTNGPRVDIPLR